MWVFLPETRFPLLTLLPNPSDGFGEAVGDQVRIAFRRHRRLVPEHPADCEQVDSSVNHFRRCAVPKIVKLRLRVSSRFARLDPLSFELLDVDGEAHAAREHGDARIDRNDARPSVLRVVERVTHARHLGS